jgi:predicted site-specific integrase-resolvase
MTLNLKLLKIGLYARVSSEKQAQEKTINSQIASIVEYTNSLEEKLIQIYILLMMGLVELH